MIFDPHVHLSTFPFPVGKSPFFLPLRNLCQVGRGGEPGRHRKLRENTAGAVLIISIYLKAIFKKVDTALPFLSRIRHFEEHREVIFFTHLTPICWRALIRRFAPSELIKNRQENQQKKTSTRQKMSFKTLL